MSMKRLHRSSPPRRAPRRLPSDPKVCARLLGEHIRNFRLMDGRPLEELAPLAGLTVEVWEAIEAGETLCAWECIITIAMALRLGDSWRQYLAPIWDRANPLPVYWPVNS